MANPGPEITSCLMISGDASLSLDSNISPSEHCHSVASPVADNFLMDEKSEHNISKRQKLGPTEWNQNKTKAPHETGQSCISQNGMKTPVRQMAPPCSCKSKSTNCGALTTEDRTAIFNLVGSLDCGAKRSFVSGLVQKIPVKRRRVRNGDPRRLWIFRFSLMKVSGHVIPVCKKMFFNTTALTWWFVRTYFKDGESPNGPTKKSKDGESPKGPTKNSVRSSYYDRSKEDKKFLSEFLVQLSKIPSYCFRQHSSKLCLTSNFKSMAALYRYYLNKCEEVNQRKLSLTVFKEMFHASNLSLFIPIKKRYPTFAASLWVIQQKKFS